LHTFHSLPSELSLVQIRVFRQTCRLMIDDVPAHPSLQSKPGKHVRLGWKRMWMGHPSYWVCQFIGWFGGATGEIVASVLHSERTAFSAWFNLVGACFGIVITHLLRGLILHQGWFQWSSRKQLLWSIFLCIPAACIYVAMFFPLIWVFDPYKVKPEENGAVAFAAFFWSYSALVVWSGFYFGWHYLRHYQQAALDRANLNAALKDAELRALRIQLNPHFLFNALNSIRSLVESNPGRAREAVTLLANLLRGALSSSEKEMVPLSRELEAVKYYLALEEIRFEERLRTKFEIAPEAQDALVPPFAVQTLVENAIKHGVGTHVDGALIRIEASRSSSFLHILVSNTPGRLLAGGRSTGVGLKNLRSRLALHFEGQAELSLREAGPGNVLAEMTIPFNRAPLAERQAAGSEHVDGFPIRTLKL
jgi:two-component system LytT family sensor kinase